MSHLCLCFVTALLSVPHCISNSDSLTVSLCVGKFVYRKGRTGPGEPVDQGLISGPACKACGTKAGERYLRSHAGEDCGHDRYSEDYFN